MILDRITHNEKLKTLKNTYSINEKDKDDKMTTK